MIWHFESKIVVTMGNNCKINLVFDTYTSKYNVCFANRFEEEHEHVKSLTFLIKNVRSVHSIWEEICCQWLPIPQNNSLWVCLTMRQLSPLRSVGTQVQPGRKSCFYFSVWKGSYAVLCVHNELNWFLAVRLYSVYAV